MFGGLGDLGRLYWGLLYWNGRKALYRAKGASGTAPCQHPSDSGRAHETGCEACHGWRDASRFALVCPLLESAPGGRRVCSVPAARVRPFWGRALAAYGILACALAALSVLAAFAAFRAVGYRVPLAVVAWPPAWHEIQKARADYFHRMALLALATGDVRQAFLALGQAYALDPDDADAALLLARLSQIANPDFSDRVYSRLLTHGSPRSEEAAEAWFRALLERGDLRGLGTLSARMLGDDAGHVPAWTEGVLFSAAMTGDVALERRLLAGRLPREAQLALGLDVALRSEGAGARLRSIEVTMGGAHTPFEIYNVLTQVLALGRSREALEFLDGPEAATLAAFDREALRLDAYARLGWAPLESREIDSVLEQGSTVPVLVLLSTHLIRHPNPALAEGVFARLARRPLPASPQTVGAHMALMCMAGVNGLPARMREEADAIGPAVGGSLAAWGRVREFFESREPGKNPAAFLPALDQLPLEVLYAVVARYRAQAGPPPGSAAAEQPPG